MPNLVAFTLEKKHTLQLGKGLTEWDNVNVQDLTNLYVLLVEAAVAKNLSPEIWGEKAYFLAESGTHVWGKLAKHTAEVAHKAGYIPTTEVQMLTPDEAKEIAGFEAMSWGLNSKGKGLRAKKFLGWNPSKPSLFDSIPAIVEEEAKRAGISKGHAAKVAGK